MSLCIRIALISNALDLLTIFRRWQDNNCSGNIKKVAASDFGNDASVLVQHCSCEMINNPQFRVASKAFSSFSDT